MSWLSELFRRVRALFEKERLDQEMDEELRFHVERQTEANMQAGMKPEEARYAALRKFGWVESIKETCRDLRGVNWIEDLGRDVRFGVRMLIKTPGFTTVAVLTLAVGIGANAAILGVFNSVALSLISGVAEPNRLVGFEFKQQPLYLPEYSFPDYRDFAERNQIFAGIAAFSLGVAHLESNDAVAKLQANLVSANYFGVLGVRPLLGRTFLPNEGQVDGAEPVAVISKSLWRRHFNSDQNIVGRTIQLNGRLVTVVGVVPAFRADMFAFSPDVWMPLSAYELVTEGLLTRNQRTDTARSLLANRQRGWLRWVARLKPGVSLAQAQAGTEVLALQIKQAHPDSGLERDDFRMTATDLSAQLRRPMAGALPLGIMLLLLSLSVLVIASGNLANLLLARAEARRQEMAVRLAMGARRLRLIRQLLVESGLLGLAGGMGGLVLAYWSGTLLTGFISGLTSRIFVPLRPSITVHWGVLAFALAVALLTGLVFGLGPALHASKIDLLPALQGANQAPAGVKRRWSWRSLSIVVQVAFCFVLLTTAGLFARSLQRAHSADLGFDPENVVRIPIDLTRRSWPEAQMKQHLGQIVERLQHVPGVQSVTLTEHSPDTGGVGSFFCRTTGAMSTNIQVWGNTVGTDYFRTMKVPLVRGRDFAAEDKRGVPVVIVNETLARRFWPEENRYWQAARDIRHRRTCRRMGRGYWRGS